VPGAEILNRDFGSIERDSAVPPADPAVVDSQRDIVPSADFGRELIQHNFTRASQRILADEAEFHGSLAGENLAGSDQSWREPVDDWLPNEVGRGEKPALLMLNRFVAMSMAAVRVA
jgi:hypothetical protein